MSFDESTEWLEADGLGGFASGTVSGVRTRRYHALLLAAAHPPSGRQVLVNGLECWARTARGVEPLSSHRYTPDVIHPDGAGRIVEFTSEPWPTWTYALSDGTRLRQEIFTCHGSPLTVITWSVEDLRRPLELFVRPLLSGRDPHALQRENAAFTFDAGTLPGGIRWKPYSTSPAVVAGGNGEYRHAPEWYRNFLYAEERGRGLDHVEDLASPGVFRWDLSRGDAHLTLAAECPGLSQALSPENGAPDLERVRQVERRRRAGFTTRAERAADSYIVRRGSGKTIVAGYPWFGDWGRDTFIALRGLCLATGRLEDAGRILQEWAGAVSGGMLPNRFPDQGDAPEYNSVDASLWYVIAVHEYLVAGRTGRGQRVSASRALALRSAVESILEGYSRGTRYGIRADSDGLLAAGEAGWQLTWMDARVGDRVITPRIGKPVEVQALWLNALRAAAGWTDRWCEMFERGRQSFGERFWNDERSMLYDVVDVDHVAGQNDPACRPNQIFAVGGLPFALLDGSRARAVVAAVEGRLLTPLGLRSLAPEEPGYVPVYDGGVAERDGAYHQGTVWPWLLGALVEAWVRAQGGGSAVRRRALRRFVDPLERHLGEAGLGHVSEIADAEPPHRPRGCPFQAWSIGELLRLKHVLAAPVSDVAGVARTAANQLPLPRSRRIQPGA